MRKLLPLLVLLLAPALAHAEEDLAGHGATVVRRGSGKRLYVVSQEVRVGTEGRFRIEGGSPLVVSDGRKLHVRRPEDDTWRAVDGQSALLFPELAGREVWRARYRKAGALLFPIREEDGEIVESVSILRGAADLPKRVIVRFAGGGREQRDYHGWKSQTVLVPGVEEAGEGTLSWPPEVEWGSALETKLEAIRAKLGDVRDLSGRYVREKRTLLLSRPSIAEGRFLFVPGRLLWIDEEPRESRVLITRESMEIHDPGNKRLERFLFGESEIGKYVFLGFGDSLAEGLRGMHPVELVEGEAEVRLSLQPVGGPLAKHVSRLTIALDPKRGLLTEMTYRDPSGDSVVTKLLDVRKNTGLEPEDVAIRPPEGTKIVTNEGSLPWR